ncbi:MULTISPECIES: hypothetical protein [Nocardiopsis]|uniref:Uncharacterized protein n=1 Tax=Nocardiopsis sinuspersici TaxID=501010 RepID=A0A1V3C0S4_9ACTN|nr:MULTISPECIES: hypothetical protein [Nocardiopsis]OOC54096.1 hypothetical protein NOSIN_10000 [Nocardiopsis sinuspersici]
MTAWLFSVQGQLQLVGAVLVVLGVFHLVLPRLIDWPAQVARMAPLPRQVAGAHFFFVGVVCVLLGALPLFLAPELLAGGRVARALLAAETLFWSLRWLFQFAYFSPALWRGDPPRTLAHAGFCLLWTWVAGVFGLAWYTASC